MRTDLLQILKSVIAATAAWWLSVHVLDSPLPFLAPWTALLTVHATVHRSLSRGVQTTVASAIGVGLSFLIGFYLGVNVWTFALAMFVGLAGARVTWIRDEGVSIATTAVFVLGSGFSQQQPILMDRIIEVAVGVGIGVAVNLLLFPPMRDQQAASHVDNIDRRIGGILVKMADEFSSSWETDAADAWRSEIESVAEEVDTAWQTVHFARESRRSNPRLVRARLTRTPRPSDRHQTVTGRGVDYEEVLSRVDEAVSHMRHLIRTLHDATYSEGPWDERFRSRWAEITRDAGHAIADPDADMEPIHDRLVELTRAMAEDGRLPRDSWPVYGSLLTSMFHIAVLIDDVASARSVR
ncbi:FUSC family protein [Dietzia sp. PP-33]|uniref:FUSC family protein n=1 Tax=Dietzia sp. PP-33 TaxID=2957500 RepID=UPI0029AE2EA5|nr:aromatic acid exporter family protein [Dietzia sp. PP-33]MDX2356386.1 aromatic acid exporter family protein [Dietzia sp. PP-33]